MEVLPILVVAGLIAIAVMVLVMGDREQDIMDADDDQTLNTRSRDP